ncbi:MAG: hypothetical protein GQ571_02080 [Desulfobacterales bacterium]|jgi:hypothetical protein|nr:hypothetical protein [Deltaproteobacteria bacterium]NOQ18738.1 hypothetical protein [Desulfobacterales bacterium]
MRDKFLAIILLLMIWVCFSSIAIAAEMAPEYLYGNWVIGATEQKCGSADAEYFIFNKNGTFEAGRSKKAEAVGFWQIDGDTVYLVFIASGGFFQDIHAELKEYDNRFDSFDVKLILFNVKDNRFEAVGVLGDEVNRGIAIRCK